MIGRFCLILALAFAGAAQVSIRPGASAQPRAAAPAPIATIAVLRAPHADAPSPAGAPQIRRGAVRLAGR